MTRIILKIQRWLYLRRASTSHPIHCQEKLRYCAPGRLQPDEICQRLQLYIKSKLKSHCAQEIQSCQMLLHVKKLWIVWKYHTVFRHLFQASWTFWSLIQPYFLLLPFFFYWVIILPIIEISDFFLQLS